jgi:hypothetical protein
VLLCYVALSMPEVQFKHWLQTGYHEEFLSTRREDPLDTLGLKGWLKARGALLPPSFSYPSCENSESRNKIIWYVGRNALVALHGFTLILILVWAYGVKKERERLRLQRLEEERVGTLIRFDDTNTTTRPLRGHDDDEGGEAATTTIATGTNDVVVEWKDVGNDLATLLSFP